jgi:TrmH family RNA methyltransferase
VQDPGNLGALARVAEAGGATGLLVAGESADAFGWKALRGSMGSLLRLPVIVKGRGEEAVAAARAQGCHVVAAVPRGGEPLFGADMRVATAILIGGEGAGLPAELLALADRRVTIPMRPPVESLNAAVAAALVVYEALRQRMERPAVEEVAD